MQQGYVGIKLSSNEVVLTSLGRKTTPFPIINLTNKRSATITLKKVNEWLISNAILEANARKDRFNLVSFLGEKANNLPQASKDAMEGRISFWKKGKIR